MQSFSSIPDLSTSPDDALGYWSRLRDEWQGALDSGTFHPDGRVLLLCGVAVATRFIHDEQRRRNGHSEPVPAGQAEACLCK